MTQRAAVLGSPIGHSLSPVIHAAAYAHLGLDWSYGRVDLQPDGFAGFVDSLDDHWRGLSVTMPLKEAAAACGLPDDDVRLTGAANTVVFGDERRVYNTDIAGLVDALAEAGLGRLRTATVIGNGATARSATVALVRCGVARLDVQGRNPARLDEFRRWAGALPVDVRPRTLGAVVAPDTELLLSTVPSAAIEAHGGGLALEDVPALRRVLDVIYHPWPTALAARAGAAGLPVLSGLDLLVHQARHQVRLMTGRDVPAEVLMSAVRAELGRRAAS